MIFWQNLEDVVLKLMQNLASKLQFNGFLFCGKVFSSCSWWRSHQCLYSVFWMFYLFYLMFLNHLYKGLHISFLCTCLALWQSFSNDCSWIAMAVFDVFSGAGWLSYHLSCVADVQCNVLILFILIRQYIFHCINNPTAILQDDYYVVSLCCFHIGCFLSSCHM